MPARLLAFDTATETMLLGLIDGDRRWAQEAPGGAAASLSLLPAIEALLSEAGLSLAELDAIAFGRGPGAFTGLRTSCAVAQGLALGSGRPVLALDSLALVAESARQALAAEVGRGALQVGVCMDARMQQIYAARYRWDGRLWQTLAEPALFDAAVLASAWADAFAGDDASCLAGTACAWPDAPWGLPVQRCIADPPHRAAALIALAEAAWQAGAAIDAALALPLYVRDKVAQTSDERQAARTAREAAGVQAAP